MITVRGAILIIALFSLAVIIIVALFVIAATIFKDWFKVPMSTPAKRDYVFDSIYSRISLSEGKGKINTGSDGFKTHA